MTATLAEEEEKAQHRRDPKAEKLSSWKSLQTEDVHQGVAEKADRIKVWKNLQTKDVHQRAAARTASPGSSRMRKMRKRMRTTEMRKRPRRMKRRKMSTFRLRMPGRHHNTPDPSGLEKLWTQASAGPEVPGPSSQPQDL